MGFFNRDDTDDRQAGRGGRSAVENVAPDEAPHAGLVPVRLAGRASRSPAASGSSG